MTIANVFYPALIGMIKFVGTPLSGGKVLFCEPGAGPTTKRAVYLDAAMTSEAANPYTLDASGQAQLFTSGTYDIYAYTSADVLVYSWESYNGININAVIDNTAIADILAGTAGFEAGNALKLGGVAASLAWNDNNCPSSLGTAGWQKSKSGLIIQWGFVTLTAVNQYFTLPVAFSNSVYKIVSQNYTNLTAASYVHAYSPTQFEGSVIVGDVIVDYIAIGY